MRLPSDNKNDDYVYIYILTNPDNGDIFYIGSTRNPEIRAKAHIATKHRGKTKKHKYMMAMKCNPNFKVISRVSIKCGKNQCRRFAYLHEKYLILKYLHLGHPLTNEKL